MTSERNGDDLADGRAVLDGATDDRDDVAAGGDYTDRRDVQEVLLFAGLRGGRRRRLGDEGDGVRVSRVAEFDDDPRTVDAEAVFAVLKASVSIIAVRASGKTTCVNIITIGAADMGTSISSFIGLVGGR